MKFNVFYRKSKWVSMEIEADSKEEAADLCHTDLQTWLDSLSLEDQSNSDYEIDQSNVEEIA